MTGPLAVPAAKAAANCRLCETPLKQPVADLGAQPSANSYLTAMEAAGAEQIWPLLALVCSACYLVQLRAYRSPQQLFSQYAYFSSFSETWLRHAAAYAATATARFGLGAASRVVEVASNDGYLLQFFAARGIPVLGIEPAANVAAAAIEKGLPTRVEFFGRASAARLVAEGLDADLLVGNNVLAHVPDLHDFVAGLRIALKPEGVLTMEFPHLLRLIEGTQFDTIYHEHFSYFSLATVERAFAMHGLRLFDVEELPTHGGSLRIYACRTESGRTTLPTIAALRARERAAGLGRIETYRAFGERVKALKRRLVAFLIEAKEQGKSIVGYGAAAKGNTLLNYCGIRTDFIDYVVDANPRKQGLFLPGTRIPVFAPRRIQQTRPDLVLILAWNLAEEIVAANADIAGWGGQFVVPVPEPRIVATPVQAALAGLILQQPAGGAAVSHPG